MARETRGDRTAPSPALDDEELRNRLELRQLDRLRVCYAPLDYIRRDARIAVVGLTPGRHTFRASIEAARQLLKAGASDTTVLRRAKETAPFSDPGTRRRLIRWLDDLGVANALDLHSCDELYGRAGKLVHWTSLIRYPVFRWDARRQDWTNYSRHPDPMRCCEDMIVRAFVPELRQLRAEAIVTLGDKVRGTTRRLALDGLIEGDRLIDLPHPSGANVGNDQEYARRRRRLRRRMRVLLSESE